MTRIVYGVSGEGSGHSSRAREIIPYLEKAGHEVRVVTYGRGHKDLKGDFDVFETEGLTIATADNAVSVVRTITDNLSRLGSGQKKYRDLKRELFDDFSPHAVVTDFEPMTAYLANRFELPLITLDNQHRMRYMEYPCPPSLRASAMLTETVIRAMVPRPDVSLVTTFYFGRVKNDRTFLFPPILRREVLEARPADGDHILVYLTRGFDTFLARLRDFRRERFIVYGVRDGRGEGNLTYRPFSREGFLDDLASCRAVMATAGFTLITEALKLGKPYLALPMKGQFEQELNGHLLAEMSCGKCCRRVTREAVGDFLYRLPDYRLKLKGYPSSDNSGIKVKLGELLDRDGALALTYHRGRRG